MKIKPAPQAAAALSAEGHDYTRLLGVALRQARSARGLTRSQLASQLLIGEATLKRMELGDPRVSLGYYLAAGLQLGVPVLAAQVSPQVGIAAAGPAARSRAARKRPSDDWFQ